MKTPTTRPTRTTAPAGPDPATVRERDAAALYTGHLKLAWRFAGKFSDRYGLPYTDAKDEAESGLALIIAEWHDGPAAARYDPKLCNPTSWVYRRLYWHLLTWATRLQPREVPFSRLPRRGGDDAPDGALLPPQATGQAAPERWIDGVLRSVGEDAKIIITTILFGPAEFIEDIMPRNRRPDPADARAYLADAFDWDGGRFDAAWEEATEAL